MVSQLPKLMVYEKMNISKTGYDFSICLPEISGSY